MKKDSLVYIEDILNSCDRILDYVGDITFEQMQENQMLIDAIIRNIEIIGEAAKRLDDDFKIATPAFPIRDTVTMRNKLIHDYNMVDYQVVWNTTKIDIPELKALCQKILNAT